MTAEMRRLTKRVRHEKAGDAGATCCVGLQNINRAGVEHAAEVTFVVSVFASGDLYARRALRRESNAVRRDRPTRPALRTSYVDVGKSYASSRACLREYAPLASTNNSAHRRLRCARQRRARGRGLDRDRSSSSHAEFLVHPAAQLLSQLFVCVRCEAAAAVNRQRFAHRAEQLYQWNIRATAPSNPTARCRWRKLPSTRPPAGRVPNCCTIHPTPRRHPSRQCRP